MHGDGTPPTFDGYVLLEMCIHVHVMIVIPIFLFHFLFSPDNDDDITDSDCFIFPTNELARRYGDLAERRERYAHYYM